VCMLRTLVVSCLQHLQNLCGYLLPFATLANLLWLLLTVCNNFFHLIELNLQAYFMVIAICWQISFYGRNMCPTLKVKQRIVILSFLLKKNCYYMNTTKLYTIIIWTIISNILSYFKWNQRPTRHLWIHQH